MALRNLSTGAMVSLTKNVVDPGHADHKALAEVPVTAGLLGPIATAHHKLLRVQASPAGRAAPKRLLEIQAEARATDLRHDELVRGLHAYLSGLAAIVVDPDVHASLVSVRDALFPDGLSITQMSYRDEAGAAHLAKARLTAEEKKLLRSLTTPAGTAMQAVDEWFRSGERLGALEDERTTIEVPTGTTAADALAARNEWIRVINAVRATLVLVDEVPAAVQAILSRIEVAERRATAEPEVATDAAPAPPPTA